MCIVIICQPNLLHKLIFQSISLSKMTRIEHRRHSFTFIPIFVYEDKQLSSLKCRHHSLMPIILCFYILVLSPLVKVLVRGQYSTERGQYSLSIQTFPQSFSIIANCYFSYTSYMKLQIIIGSFSQPFLSFQRNYFMLKLLCLD